MSEKTTKPNGGSMRVEENSEDVQKRIEEAGYNDLKVTALQVEFSAKEIEKKDSSTSSDSTDAKKAGKHTMAGKPTAVIFKDMIPPIVDGPKVSLKKGKKKVNTRVKKDEELAKDNELGEQ